MRKSNLVDKMYKFRQLFPHVSKKVVYAEFKKEKLSPKERENKFQKEAA